MTVVFDLDGTLTDTRHRDHLAEAEQWDEYHEACADDPPNAPMVALYEMLSRGGCMPKIWTGRSESQRQATQEWFATLAIDDRATQVAWWRSKGVPALDCGGNEY